MPLKLPKIYPLTDVSVTKLSHLEQVRQLIAGGATLIQLRDKYAAPKDFYIAAKEVIEYARPQGVKIIINDRVDIALAVKADGVHLGQDDLPPEKARAILGEQAIIGFSTHGVQQAIEASKFPLDYIAIGPIFTTISKENPDAVVGLENLQRVRAAVGDFPLVAIGGINFENASSVLRNGADSLAVIGAVMNPPDKISENYRQILRVLR